MDVRLRALQQGDWQAVRQIYADGIATGNATFETDVPPADVLDSKWLPGQRWVAELNGTVIGWASISPTSARDCYRGVGETSVYVDVASAGMGVGSALVRHQVAAAEVAGLWTLQTSIFPENIASLAIHHAAGFRDVGRRERIAHLDGVWRDTILLERRAGF
ncbi:L-amino acid N-acyltransferase YncA [Aeromicrobium panaciterrae]|uniref:L-amino acid N-acyltransferase YncA n=1 Tax=Aeromicrobium panaciterrae TaxID=363861 RepID=A0ABU1UL48_9ACTN|nr:N-acetyltransferase family protein [Aeromicrobium panaciterrae]MDR7085904.1 L-amino acid N-acyltransferase YncA [Aeromicrobium panaciterrae]